MKALEPLFEVIEQIDFDEFYHERQYQRELYKLDFTRPKVQHQVLDRKPQHLIKKIIR